ncbi:MAG: isoprenylcysteine carboxylmethyltransferase family protein [Atribacterota bacterium]
MNVLESHDLLEQVGQRLFPRRGIIWGALGLFIFLFAQPHPLPFFVGICWMMGGEMLRIWGVGYIKNYRGPMKEVTDLTTAGPYAYVRNPLYLANGGIGIGIALLSGIYAAIPVFLIVFFLLYHPIINAEERFLQAQFPHDFLQYCQSVPRYFPRFTPYAHQEGAFSSQVVWEKEYHTFLTLFLVALLFYLRGFGGLRVFDRLFFWL